MTGLGDLQAAGEQWVTSLHGLHLPALGAAWPKPSPPSRAGLRGSTWTLLSRGDISLLRDVSLEEPPCVVFLCPIFWGQGAIRGAWSMGEHDPNGSLLCQLLLSLLGVGLLRK